MAVTIESKVTINGKFYATGPRTASWYMSHSIMQILPYVALHDSVIAAYENNGQIIIIL